MDTRNRISLRSRVRDARRLALLAADDEGEELAAVESMRGEIAAARDALDGLLDRLDDLDEEDLEANRERRARTPEVLTRTS